MLVNYFAFTALLERRRYEFHHFADETTELAEALNRSLGG